MTSRLSRLLEFLYGPEEGRKAREQLSAALAQWRARLGAQSAQPSQGPLTQRDVLLITYADQVRARGEAPLRTLTAFCETYLRDVVSGVHLLPFYPSSSDDGFSVRDYFSVDPALGRWDDLSRLGSSFDLMLDAVFNHLSAQGDWFLRFQRGEPGFSDFFVTVDGHPDLSRVVRPRALPLLTEFPTAAGTQQVWTTFSADQVDLNYRNSRVLVAVVEALLFYVSHGARFIRLDAIAFVWKEVGTPCVHLPQTHALVQILRAVLDEVAPWVRLITETNVPHADNLSYFGDGTNEAQLVYNFALPPLVLHSLAAGNAEALTRWAQALRVPSPRVTFLNFLASHDGIGLNPVRGILSEAEIGSLVQRTLAQGGLVSFKHNPDGSRSPYELNLSWFDALNDPAARECQELQLARMLVSHAAMLSLPGVPAIYFHSLFGSRSDRAAAERSGIPRRINRQKLSRPELDRALKSPRSLRARVFSALGGLLQRRRQVTAFNPQGGVEVLELDRRVFAVRRSAPEGRRHVLCLHNLSPVPVVVRLPQRSLPREWVNLATGNRMAGTAIDRTQVPLGPYEFVWGGLPG